MARCPSAAAVTDARTRLMSEAGSPFGTVARVSRPSAAVSAQLKPVGVRAPDEVCQGEDVTASR
jgi:hypothetical protein